MLSLWAMCDVRCALWVMNYGQKSWPGGGNAAGELIKLDQTPGWGSEKARKWKTKHHLIYHLVFISKAIVWLIEKHAASRL